MGTSWSVSKTAKKANIKIMNRYTLSILLKNSGMRGFSFLTVVSQIATILSYTTRFIVITNQKKSYLISLGAPS